ncbi:rod shape-determining protein [Candidatus Parcubacteria bacterium]|nr:MAG: rod shape-determining protein [Candidatus Parcubacteria bacterium]
MFKNFLTKFSKDMAIDLGTSNTLVYVKDRGVVVNESSVVAINTRNDQILSIGEEASKMIGKTPPHIVVSKPLLDGVISDFEVTEKMLKYFINKVQQENSFMAPRPKVVVGIPLDITEVEKKAVEDAIMSAGAREVHLVENVIASAIGARLPIQDPSGNAVVNIGGGLTEIAIISLSGVVAWRSLKTAGRDFDHDIINFARNEYNLLVGERNAERIKMQLEGFESDKEVPLKIRGRDLITGLPKEISINPLLILHCMDRSVKMIVENIKATLEITPPELTADIYQKGILLTGGGSLLKGLDKVIAKAIRINVQTGDDPLTCVVRGLGILLDDKNLLKEVAVPSSSREEETVR